MKSQIPIILMIIAFVVMWQGCTKPEETGTIYGTVTDFATGEPLKNVNVKLRPSGETTLTGSDGTYMFQDLKKGDYSLSLSKAGYKDLVDDYLIQLAAGKSVRRDVQMKIKSLRITDMNGEDINELDFGSEGDDVSRIFNIFNDSGETISWEIITTANWIESPETGTSGTLQAGGNKGVVVKIDRNKLQQGDNTTTMHITSNNGNQQLTIKARRADVSTLDATDVSGNSAVLNGKINGNVIYTEKGFYYGTDHNLSTKVVVNGNGAGAFSTQITGLIENTTYYFKAYCICDGEYLYGEEKSFTNVNFPTFEYNGHTYWVAPVSNKMQWSMANSYCNNFSIYGIDGWRMPTIEELTQMYLNGIRDYPYWLWSSTKVGNTSYYCVYMNDGDIQAWSSTHEYCVRPVKVAY